MTIEETVISFLNEHMDVPVYGEFPADPPARMVVVHKGDSRRSNRLDTAMMVADSYGTSKGDSDRLNESTKAAMEQLAELPVIAGVRLKTDYPAFDTQNKRHRYQAVYDITHY